MTDSLARLTTAVADRYRIERELGQGGMATVYLAEDLKHKRRVAVKVLRPELAAVLGAERFVQEITTTAALQHPHILPLFDSGEADGFLYYVMPFVDGETLRAKLDRETQLGVDESVKITVAVADALDYAHRRGVIHRDIKPENILLQEGRPLVADFGIALAVSAAAGGRMTETGLSLGTPHYMSPEQATAEKDISARSDIYSLASVCYEMLAGQPPHLGGSAQQIIMKIIAETVEPVTRYRKAVPPHVDAALATALEKLPADRFSSAREFAEALGDESRKRRIHPAAMHSASRARWLVWIPTALAAVMMFAVALMLTRKSSLAPERPMRFVLARMTEGADDQGLSVSSDGRLVVYVATSGGVSRVYRRSLGDISTQPLSGTEGALEAVVSPDGRSVAVQGSDERLSIIPVDGGRSRSIIHTTVPAGLSWSASRGLVLGMPAYSSKIWGLSVVRESGDTALNVLTSPKPAAMHHDPYVLDDGETVLYTVVQIDSGLRRTQLIGVGSLSGKNWTTTTLTTDGIAGVADGILVYRDGGAMMGIRFDTKTHRPVGDPVRISQAPSGVQEAAMSSDGTLAMRVRSDRFQIALVNERGESQLLLPDTVAYLFPRFAPDGKRAALSVPLRGADGGVWTLNIADKTLSKLSARFTTGVDWARDGRRIAAANGGRTRWLSADHADSTTEFLAFGDQQLEGLALSPDGSALVVVGGYREGGFNLLMRRTIGDTAIVPLVATKANEYAPRFSPDGRWLAYTSDETGRPEVYVQPFPGPGPRIQISTEGGGQAVWASDSRRIFFRSGRAFIVADLSGGAAGGPLSVTARRKLFEGSFYGSNATSGGATYDVTPDGRTFLVGRTLGDAEGEIVVWTGWLQELKAQLAQAHK